MEKSCCQGSPPLNNLMINCQYSEGTQVLDSNFKREKKDEIRKEGSENKESFK